MVTELFTLIAVFIEHVPLMVTVPPPFTALWIAPASELLFAQLTADAEARLAVNWKSKKINNRRIAESQNRTGCVFTGGMQTFALVELQNPLKVSANANVLPAVPFQLSDHRLMDDTEIVAVPVPMSVQDAPLKLYRASQVFVPRESSSQIGKVSPERAELCGNAPTPATAVCICNV